MEYSLPGLEIWREKMSRGRRVVGGGETRAGRKRKGEEVRGERKNGEWRKGEEVRKESAMKV